jgi:uncharacterized membrane protein
MVETNTIIGIIIGLAAYMMVNFGRGLQKMAIEGYKFKKNLKSKNSWIWVFGSFLAIIYMFIQWIALLFAPINIIAPLEGVGLIVLILFSYFILNEDILKTEILGIILIISGIILVTAFNTNPRQIQLSDFNLVSFIITFSFLLLFESILIIISRFNQYKAAGLVIGFTAGTFMAFQTVSKRITAIPDTSLKTIFSVSTFIIALLTFFTTQFAFSKSKANRVIPCFTSASITLSIIIGVIALNESIIIIQIVGICVVIFGVICLTAFRKED